MPDNVKYPVITISREYAAGGRTIARALSEKLGIPWYDRDLVKATASASGYEVEEINQEGEELSKFDQVMESLMSTGYQTSHTAIFKAQKEVILELAQKPCIIVGRCANIILQEAGVRSLDVYLYCDRAHKLAHAEALNENGEEELEKYVEHRDKLRANYYKAFTKRTFGDKDDYDLMLNTGLLGYDRCIELILELEK